MGLQRLKGMNKMHARHSFDPERTRVGDTANRVLIISRTRGHWAALDRMCESRGLSIQVFGLMTQVARSLRSSDTAVIMIDFNGVSGDGLAELQTLRSQTAAPIVAVMDHIEPLTEAIALRCGADLVARKDCDATHMTERLCALTRRHTLAQADAQPTGGTLDCGQLSMDKDRFLVTWNGRTTRLTRTEFALLHFLAERPGHLRTREQIYHAIYGGSSTVYDRTIDGHIKRVRRKLRVLDPSFDQIETVYGLGYLFHATAPQAKAA